MIRLFLIKLDYNLLSELELILLDSVKKCLTNYTSLNLLQVEIDHKLDLV